MPKADLRTNILDSILIAPCGLNCALCRAFIRSRHPCPGCRSDDGRKSNACVNCVIKNCERLAAGGLKFCHSCSDYPCRPLKHLDDRYRAKYRVSAIANLELIKSVGVKKFVVRERAAWSCQRCGKLLCMHEPQCVTCGHSWRSRTPAVEGAIRRTTRTTP